MISPLLQCFDAALHEICRLWNCHFFFRIVGKCGTHAVVAAGVCPDFSIRAHLYLSAIETIQDVIREDETCPETWLK